MAGSRKTSLSVTGDPGGLDRVGLGDEDCWLGSDGDADRPGVDHLRPSVGFSPNRNHEILSLSISRLRRELTSVLRRRDSVAIVQQDDVIARLTPVVTIREMNEAIRTRGASAGVLSHLGGDSAFTDDESCADAIDKEDLGSSSRYSSAVGNTDGGRSHELEESLEPPLTAPVRACVVDRAQRDPDFARALLVEAACMIGDGDAKSRQLLCSLLGIIQEAYE